MFHRESTIVNENGRAINWQKAGKCFHRVISQFAIPWKAEQWWSFGDNKKSCNYWLRKATDLLVQGMTVVAGRCLNVMTKTDLKTQQKDQGRLNKKRTQLLMGNSQERSVLIFIVGFFSLIFALILLCFCLFTLYNCFYGRMMRKHSERKDSEQTQSTDIEINGQLLQSDGDNEELLPFRHETRTTETTGL